MQTEKFTYRTYIEREFESRCRRNPRYSLRAFARDLNVQASKISEILKHQCGLSAQAAVSMALKLRLSETETQHFVTMVEVEHSRSQTRKQQAAELLKNFHAVHGFSEIDLERFKIISDWYHFAILELTELKDFKSDCTWIARRLLLPEQTIKDAIERLLEFGLLRENPDGSWTQTNVDLATPSGIPSREIRDHHSQMIQKALESVDKFELAERAISCTTIAVNSDQLDEAKQVLLEFRRKFAKDFQAKDQKDRVYCLSLQLFPLDVAEEKQESYL